MADKRRLIELLPQLLQNNDQLKKFFNANVDPLFQPEDKKKLSGYIGKFPSYYDSTKDFYVAASSSERQFYQFEPAMVSRDSDDEITLIETYPDLVNHLRFQGANVDNHSRLFDQNSWSWAPPIDIDKFTNFSNYYWYPEGPTPVDITATVSDPINVENDILGVLEYTSPNNITFKNGMKITFGATNITPSSYQNNTYFVEGVGRAINLVHEDIMDPSTYPLELSNSDKEYITIERGAADQNPWSRTNHWYHKNQILLINDDTDNVLESDESNLWDADPWDTVAWDSVTTILTSEFNLDIERQAKRPIIEFTRNIELYNFGSYGGTATYLDDTTTNVFLDIHGQAVGSVSYDGNVLAVNDTILVTNDANDQVNNRVYQVSQVGTDYSLDIVSVGQDISGNPIVGDKVLILSGDESGKEYYFNGTNYILGQRKVSENQAPLFNLYDINGNYLGDNNVFHETSFIGNEIFSYKEGDASQLIDVELGFPLTYKNFSQIAEIVFENDLLNETYSYEDNQVRTTINGYYFYKINTDDYTDESYSNMWHYNETKTTQELNGSFYEIPKNLQANPDYEDVSEITRSESIAHFSSILLNQEDETATNFTKTRFRNSAKDLSRGTEILQHEASMLKLMLMASSEDYDYMLANRFVSREYKRFRNRLINKIELFINQGIVNTNTTVSSWLDDAIKSINTSKKNTTLFPFNNTRVLPHGNDYTVATYTIAGTDFEIPNSQAFDPDALSTVDAVSVYVNDVLLLINYDYTISGSTVTLTNAVTVNDTVEIRYYSNITGSFMPATGAVLGLTPVYKPERYVDDTYPEPRKVIQCHDGSIHIEFNDERDDVIFELEKRIYNTIYEKFKGDREIFFDKNDVLPGYYRTEDYTYTEYASVLTPIFTTWATQAGINWHENTEDTTFDQGDWKTWNWSSVRDTDGNLLPGSWRAIYYYFYDTDRPHTHPWEMLGFSEKPTWWDTEYGSSYDSTNTTMWNDLALGRIRQGTRVGIDQNYTRPTLNSIIPVDTNGELQSPFDIGIAVENPTVVSAQDDWKPGDWSPAENAFWRSSERSFFMSQLLYLMKPARWVNLGWETETLAKSIIDTTQIYNSDFNLRPMNADLTVDLENGRTKAGIQQWLANRLQFNGRTISDTLGDDLRGVTSSMVWKAGGFLYNQNLRFLADSYTPGSTNTSVYIRDDDISVELQTSNSIRESFYSGVIVEWTGTGWQVVGYNSIYPYFSTIPSDTNGKFTTVSVGSTTVKEYKTSQFDTIADVPYGYEFATKQELYDFLISYERYLESEGWIFDDFDSTNNEILNWRFAGKEFLFWSEDVLDQGAFITLSPVANKVSFYTEHGFIQDVEEIVRGSYSILDRTGSAIRPNDTTVFRMDNLFEVYPTNDQGIYALRLSIKEIENTVVFDNITRFNDIVYEPLLNARQSRLKVFGVLTNNWNGRLDANGFIINSNDSNNLIPNYEKMVNDFVNYYDIEKATDNDDITDVARHLIGYQRREYLGNLFIDRDTQYQFYQGFIQQKGSRNTLQRLFRSTAITSSSDVNFLEEWAIRVGQYGATDSKKFFEIELLSNDIKVDPQIIRFTNGFRPDSPFDYIIDVPPNSSRWVLSNNKEEIEKFVLRDKNTSYKKDLPNAGYVKLNETTYSIPYPENVIDSTLDLYTADTNETLWVALDNNGYMRKHSWDVKVLTAPSYYVFSNETDLQELFVYGRQDFTGDGSTTSFELTNSLANVTATDQVRVYVNDSETLDFTAASNFVTFNSAPADSSSIEVYFEIESSNINDTMIAVCDNTDEDRFTGLIETFNTNSVTMRAIDDVLVPTIFERKELFVWESLRYASVNDVDLDILKASYPNHYFYFDQDAANTGWVVYKSTNGSFIEIERQEENLTDIESINSALIYDSEADAVVTKITTYDPFKGVIPGIVDMEITYKLTYDPARYNSGDNVFERVWGINQVGKVWWDLSTVAYLYYEMESLDYKYQNWGKLFPGTEIKMYEWVRSPVPPTEWADYVTGAKTNFDYTFSGTVKDIDSVDGPNWVEKSEEGTTFYYFWVEDSDYVPLVEFRSQPLVDLVKTLEDPNSEGIKWLSILDASSFVVGNIDTDLNDESTVLQFNYVQIDTDNLIHHQWELLRENDSFSSINDRHWNKMRDSLVGYDDLNKEVPDVSLKGNARYGHLIRPRQTWFKDKLGAREVFINSVNSTLAEINMLELISDYDQNLSLNGEFEREDNVLVGTVANPSVSVGDQFEINGEIVTFSGLNSFTGIADDINTYITDSELYADIIYVGTDAFIQIIGENGKDINITDVIGTPAISIGLATGLTSGSEPNYTVNTRAERNALTTVSVGEEVLILNDEELRNYWSLWEYVGIDPSDDENWLLKEVQSYKTETYWDYIPWYDTGFNASSIIDVTYDTISELDDSLSIDTLAKVKDDGSGRWAWYNLTDAGWEKVALEDATIEFSAMLYDPNAGGYGFDNTLFDEMPFDDVPNTEFRIILDAIRNDIFINSLEIEQNKIFFTMLNHVHSENVIIDWAFKTSYIFIVGFTEELSQPPVYTYDGFESLIDYVNEVKPYHTKIKDIIRSFATVTDVATVTAIDYDKPVYNDNGTLTVLDVNDSNDRAVLNTDPWLYWLNEYSKDARPNVPRANNVRKIKTKIRFDRISGIKDNYALAKYNNALYQENTPYYSSDVDSVTAKDARTINFLDNYVGSFDDALANASTSGMNFVYKFDGDLTDTGYLLAANNASIFSGTEVYTDSLIPTLPNAQSYYSNQSAYINIPGHVNLSSSSTTSLKLNVVFQADVIHSAAPQIIYKDGGGSRGTSVMVYKEPDGISRVYCSMYEAGFDSISAPIDIGKTYLLTFAYDLNNDYMNMYLNGSLVASKAGPFTTTSIASHTSNSIGGSSTGSFNRPLHPITGIQMTTTEVNNAYFQGKIQYFSHEQNDADGAALMHTNLWNAFNNNIEIHDLSRKPAQDAISITSTGITNSVILIEGNTEPDFTGTTTTVATFDENETIIVNHNDILDYPYLRANIDNHTYNETVNITTTVLYENAFSRILDYYKAQSGQPSLLDLLNYYFAGTIIDGYNINLEGGWDSSPWDFAGWDFTGDISEFLDAVYDGGSYFVYVGDNTTGVYNLPTNGEEPWYVSVTNPAGTTITDLVITTDYTIASGQITLTTGGAWMNGSNLDTDYKLTVMDRTFKSNQDSDIIIEGNKLVQPNEENYPEEIAPLVIEDSIVTTVVTTAGPTLTMIDAATATEDGEVFTFADAEPVKFTTTGISGDTVVIEGSNSGLFDGEETTIVSITTNTSVVVPDVGSGYESFTYYRARVTVYSAGTITVTAELNLAPFMLINELEYNATDGTGPYAIGQNVEETDDILIALNGTFLELTTDYTVSTVNNEFTFTGAQTPGDLIEVMSWNAENTDATTDPTLTTFTYTTEPTNLATQSSDVGPTEPRDNTIFVAGDVGSGFRRLTPPEARYFTGNGVGTEYPLTGAVSIGSSNIDVWINDTLQTGGGTDYTYNEGGSTAPSAAVAAGGSSYVVNDVLTVSGGTGTAVTLKVLEVSSGAVTLVAVVNPGLYTSTPGNPVSTTGGSGTGATFNLTNYSIIADTISFTTAPDNNDRIGVRVLGGEDYSINTANDNMSVSGLTLTTDSILTYTFRTDDSPMNIKTQVFDGNSVAENGVYKYALDQKGASKDKMIVTVYLNGGTIGGTKIPQTDFTVENIAGSWDSDSWDTAGFEGSKTIVNLTTSYASADKVVITTFAGFEATNTITYRDFTGYDNNDVFREYTRLSTIGSTTLNITLQPDASSITLADASVFDANGGIAWINGERIEYLQRTGTTGGTLTGLIRGTKGTRKNKVHKVGTTVYVGSDTEQISYGEINMFNSPELTLGDSTTPQARFIQEQPGGYKSWT